MSSMSQKIINLRKKKGYTQEQLALLAGVTKRTVASYETDGRLPHPSTLKKIAEALGVTSAYLKDDNAAELMPSKEDIYIEHLENMYGSEMASEVADLLNKNASLFAGGKLDQESKDLYFLALTNAYIACKGGKE